MALRGHPLLEVCHIVFSGGGAHGGPPLRLIIEKGERLKIVVGVALRGHPRVDVSPDQFDDTTSFFFSKTVRAIASVATARGDSPVNVLAS